GERLARGRGGPGQGRVEGTAQAFEPFGELGGPPGGDVGDQVERDLPGRGAPQPAEEAAGDPDRFVGIGWTVSGVPGSRRSRSIAEHAGSRSRSRTAPSPSHASRASASNRASQWGYSTFRTAVVPSLRRTGATNAVHPPWNGSPTDSDHRAARSSTIAGRE